MIGKNASFVIYGGGEVGSDCYRKLHAKGYHVRYALDKNKSGDDIIQGLHTYSLGEEIEEPDKANSVVIICLANGLIHKKVAESLYEAGYQYIVFLPIGYCIADYEKRELTRKYNYFLNADTLLKEQEIYHYEKYLLPDLQVENAILRETQQEVTVLCGMELLFSESMELWTGDKSRIHTKAEYKDKNIASNNPCKILFDYFDMETEHCDFYFESKKEKKSPEEKRKELDARELLFRVFKTEHNKGMDFFIEGCPPAVWNPKNYWNLVGGHHRTLYLLHEGHSLFPIKVKKTDFEKWCNKQVYEEVCEYIYRNHIQSLYAPLPHPGFLNFPSRYENNGKTKLEALIRFLSDKDISKMNSLDCLEDEGYFARNLNRIGVMKSVFRSAKKEQLRLAELCNLLLYREDIVLEDRNTICDDSKYDMVFCGEEEKEQLQMICKKFLFIEKNIDIDDFQKKISSSDYTCLLQEYRAGSIHEFGVYTI